MLCVDGRRCKVYSVHPFLLSHQLFNVLVEQCSKLLALGNTSIEILLVYIRALGVFCDRARHILGWLVAHLLIRPLMNPRKRLEGIGIGVLQTADPTIMLDFLEVLLDIVDA